MTPSPIFPPTSDQVCGTIAARRGARREGIGGPCSECLRLRRFLSSFFCASSYLVHLFTWMCNETLHTKHHFFLKVCLNYNVVYCNVQPLLYSKIAHLYRHIYISIFFSIMAYHKILTVIPCYTVRWCCLYILFESTTPKLPIHPSSYLLPLATTSIFSLCPWFCLYFINRFICVIF